jgi:alpha-ketoglutarate-dependent taurine dioxygenase
MTSSPQIRPLGETLGAEALGIDLSKPFDEATSAWVVRAFAENPVLVFRDQDLAPSSSPRSGVASAPRGCIR